MASFPRKVALLIGSACSFAVPAVAQNAFVSGKATETVQPSAPPRSTAAAPLTVVPVEGGKGPIGPVYQPDNGGILSGLPYDRRAPVVPATAPIRSLAEAVTLAYRTNPDMLVARAQARSSDFRLPQARAAFGPSIDATGRYSFRRNRSELFPGTFTGAQGWSSSASAVLTQPLFTFGRNAANEAGALAASQFQRSSLRVTEAQVMNEVVGIYIAVVRDAALVTSARENFALLERQLRDNNARYEVRDLTQTDLEQTRTRAELGRAQLLQAEGQLGDSQKRFLQIVGAPPGELAPPDLIEIRFGSLNAAYAYAEANSGLVHAAQAREKISRAAVEAARAEWRPRFDLRGSVDYGTISPYNDRLRTTDVVGQVAVTQQLFDSGLRNARIGEAHQANEADWRLLDATLRDTRQAIGSSWDQLASTRTSLSSYKAAVAAAERAYDGARLQERAGDLRTLDVLDLARDLLTVRNNYTQAVANEYLARANLLAAAGMLEAPLLLPGFVGYDADAHFEQVRRRGDVPLLTPVLSALDGVTSGDMRSDRVSRDAGAAQALDQTMPLPPPPAP